MNYHKFMYEGPTPVKGHIEEIIEYTKKLAEFDPYRQPQIEILNKNGRGKSELNGPFLEYLNSIAYKSWVDELGGESNHRRTTTDLEIKDIVHQAHTGIACGIKVVHKPRCTLWEWEKWEDGYLEGFCRMTADEEVKESEWMTWLYIEMSYLKEILTKFQDDLYLL